MAAALTPVKASPAAVSSSASVEHLGRPTPVPKVIAWVVFPSPPSWSGSGWPVETTELGQQVGRSLVAPAVQAELGDQQARPQPPMTIERERRLGAPPNVRVSV